MQDENSGLELTPENVDTVLDEIRWGGGCSSKRHSWPLWCWLPRRPQAAWRCALRAATARCVFCPTTPPIHPPPPTRRPYLVGTGGGGLDLVELDGPIAKVGAVAVGTGGLVGQAAEQHS